jgi:uncharacterized protein YaaW (UPF0174 family)
MKPRLWPNGSMLENKLKKSISCTPESQINNQATETSLTQIHTRMPIQFHRTSWEDVADRNQATLLRLNTRPTKPFRKAGRYIHSLS